MQAGKPPVDALLRVPTPSYHVLLAYATSVSRGGSNDDHPWSIELLEGLLNRYPHVLAIGQELVLALLESGEDDKAADVLEELDRVFTNLDEETQCRWGRLFKDQGDAYVRLPWSGPDGRPPDPEMASVFYKKSLDRYDQAYRIRSGHYPGINKATLLLILGTLNPPSPNDAPAKELADSEALAAALLADRARWPVGYPEDETLWHPATAGEAYLLRRMWDSAAQQYGEALESRYINAHARNAMHRQVERIRMCFEMLGVTIPSTLGDPKTFFGIALAVTNTTRATAETTPNDTSNMAGTQP
jgi:hypothetical protein